MGKFLMTFMCHSYVTFMTLSCHFCAMFMQFFYFNYFRCQEFECKSHSKQDFLDHITAYQTWVRFFLVFYGIICENYGVMVDPGLFGDVRKSNCT